MHSKSKQQGPHDVQENSSLMQPQAILQPPETGDSSHTLRLLGSWTVKSLEDAAKLKDIQIKNLGFTKISSLEINDIHDMDTSGAMLINQMRLQLGSGTMLPVKSTNPDHLSLIELTSPASQASVESARSNISTGVITLALEAWARHLHGVGETVIGFFKKANSMISFFGFFLITFGKSLASPHKIRWTSLLYHIAQTGIGAIPIVALLSFLIGTVLAYMTATQLATFGAEIYVVKLLEISVMREMGVLITAILVAGRSGSSYTAQIGSMVANQEIDAMRSMGMDPMHMLVFPRVAALVLSLPMLVLVADVAGILGGLSAVWLSLDISPATFMETLQKGMNINNCFAGLIKAPFFAVVISCVGCFYGFQADGSSDSVGRMTTRSVVEGIFLVITMDAFFALFFTSINF